MEENRKFGAPAASVFVSLLAEKELLLWYISGVGGVVLMYQPHSGDTYPLESAGLPPVLVENDGMVMPAPAILGMYLLEDELAMAGSRSMATIFLMADLVGFC